MVVSDGSGVRLRDSMISVNEISKRFGRIRAVDRISLALDAGRVVGLLGPNGAGKSTTIRIVTGALPPDTGDVELDGVSITRDPIRARRSLGYLPEAAPLYPEMSVRGYLHFRGRLWGMDRSDRREAVGRVAERCGVEGVLRRRIGTLSKGYRRRVGIAATLVHGPKVLVLDEPTDGLDPGQVREIRGLIRELGQDRTMLICSHQLTEVEKTCDRVVVMAGGRIRADGTLEEISAASAGPAKYLAELRANPSAPPDLVPRVLAGVSGVVSASATPDQPADHAAGWRRVRVEAERGAPDLREALAGAAADAGLFLRELIRERTTLEAVFVALTESVSEERAGGEP